MRPFLVTILASLLLVLGVSPAASQDGEELYAKHCESCHGASGRADTPIGEKLKIPDLDDASAEAIEKAMQVPIHRTVASKLGEADYTAIAAVIAGFGASQP